MVLGKLPKGSKGNIATVRIMMKLARVKSRLPILRQLALNILQAANIPSHNYLDEAKAIARFVRSKVRYVRDPQGVESLAIPDTLIKDIQKGVAQGDCDDMSLLIASLLLAIGHQPYFRMVKYKKHYPSYQHIYVIVKARNPGKPPKILALDGIAKGKPIAYEVKHAVHMDFKI